MDPNVKVALTAETYMSTALNLVKLDYRMPTPPGCSEMRRVMHSVAKCLRSIHDALEFLPRREQNQKHVMCVAWNALQTIVKLDGREAKYLVLQNSMNVSSFDPSAMKSLSNTA
jgi:hypothetical protein